MGPPNTGPKTGGGEKKPKPFLPGGAAGPFQGLGALTGVFSNLFRGGGSHRAAVFSFEGGPRGGGGGGGGDPLRGGGGPFRNFYGFWGGDPGGLFNFLIISFRKQKTGAGFFFSWFPGPRPIGGGDCVIPTQGGRDPLGGVFGRGWGGVGEKKEKKPPRGLKGPGRHFARGGGNSL